METRNVSAAERRERFYFNGLGRYEAHSPVNGRKVPFLSIFACTKKGDTKNQIQEYRHNRKQVGANGNKQPQIAEVKNEAGGRMKKGGGEKRRGEI